MVWRVNLCLLTTSLAPFGPGLLIGEIGSLRRIAPGTSNVSADDLSRNFKADTEWALSKDVFPGCVVSAGCQILTFSRAGLITKSPSTPHGSQTPLFLRGCFYSLLARVLECICFPTFLPCWYMSAESNASTSYIDYCCPVVVHASMIHKVAKPSNGPPKNCQSHQGSLSQSNSRPNDHSAPS